MYDYFRGPLIEVNSSIAVIDIHGIGYKLFIPAHLSEKLPPIGSEITLYTYHVVREDAQNLYGFFEKNERDLFEKLLSISGIGPKTALNIIGHLPLPLFTKAVQRNDIATFTKVPGIGKKTAERLLLELRGKLDDFHYEIDVPIKKISDAEKALINLGYTRNLARKALEKAMKELPEECDLSTLISFALKNKS